MCWVGQYLIIWFDIIDEMSSQWTNISQLNRILPYQFSIQSATDTANLIAFEFWRRKIRKKEFVCEINKSIECLSLVWFNVPIFSSKTLQIKKNPICQQKIDERISENEEKDVSWALATFHF